MKQKLKLKDSFLLPAFFATSLLHASSSHKNIHPAEKTMQDGVKRKSTSVRKKQEITFCGEAKAFAGATAFVVGRLVYDFCPTTSPKNLKTKKERKKS